MIKRIRNLLRLIFVLKERGNWKLIRHSKKQLEDFMLCRSGLNQKSPIGVGFYWYHLLKGPEVLIWRLETFGFLFSPESGPERRKHLNRYL
ncbi:MAG: hypothetical protein CL877_09090 [Dehalococcoidales bacterium]|jgi:hypothetical protein|nr:hypothetical protein [Dehalococcoidales bacterium]